MGEGAAQLLAEPGDTGADSRKDRGFDDLWVAQSLAGADDEDAHDQTKGGGEQAPAPIRQRRQRAESAGMKRRKAA